MEFLDLDKAFKRVWRDKRDDAWPDIVTYHDYRYDLPENLDRLSTALSTHYRAHSIAPCLDIPKKGLTLRPAIIPHIQDRIVYQAIADFLAPHFEPEESVCSNKLASPHSESMFLPGVRLWTEFQDRVEEQCDAYQYVVETDLTAYFEHIQHPLLYDRLRDVYAGSSVAGEIGRCRSLLNQLLSQWRGISPKHFGLPQVNDASSFFANLYLDDLDKWLVSHNYVSLRYVDDLRIFVNSETDARRALADVITKLRGMGLYVSSAKTRIRQSNVVASELARRREIVDPIESAIESRKRSRIVAVQDYILQLFAELCSPNLADDRLFRYCVNRLKMLKAWGFISDDYGADATIQPVLDKLYDMPESTDIFVDYLSLYADNPNVQNDVIRFLQGPYSIYPWQQLHLLELLLRAESLGTHSSYLRQLTCEITENQRHLAIRGKAYVLRGKIGTYSDRRDIRDQYYREPDEYLRRAIIVAVQEIDDRVRKSFFDDVLNDSPAIGSTIKYISSLSQPAYHYYSPPSYPDLINDDSDDLPDLGSDYFA